MLTSASGEPAEEDEVCSMAGWRLGWVGAAPAATAAAVAVATATATAATAAAAAVATAVAVATAIAVGAATATAWACFFLRDDQHPALLDDTAPT